MLLWEGVIVFRMHDNDSWVPRVEELGMPCVEIGACRGRYWVDVDHVGGARQAVEHLVGLGHRRIAHLAGQSTVSTGVLRRRGYLGALAEAGVPFDPALVVESGYTEEGGARAAERVLAIKPRPTALFAVTDMAAVGAFAQARSAGLRIPEDLAIAGYNDIPLASRLEPGLTTVHVPIHEFGTVAARLVLEQIESGAVTPRRVIFNPERCVSESAPASAARSCDGLTGFWTRAAIPNDASRPRAAV